MAQSQNLVINGSLEMRKKCPRTVTEKKLKLKHVRAIKGTPDYFNTCNTTVVNPAHNLFGGQQPFQGSGYIGLTLTSSKPNECALREYIEFDLQHPLVAGFKYLLTFQVSAADYSGYYTDQIGVVATSESLKKVGISKYIGHPHATNNLYHYMNDTVGWQTITLIINARGGERFVTLGNFQKCNFTTRIPFTPNDSVGTEINMRRIYNRDYNMLNPEYSIYENHVRKTIHENAYVFIDHIVLESHPMNEHIQEFTPNFCDELPIATANLLPDPSFESSSQRVNTHWFSPTKGTPDFEQGAAGIYLYSGNHPNNREYIATKINTQVTPCDSLYFEMKLTPTRAHQFLVDKIGVALVDSLPASNNRQRLPLLPQWETPNYQIITSRSGAIEVCGVIVPDQCANYVIIGNFATDSQTVVMPKSMNTSDAPYAHYIIDDVVLQRMGTLAHCQVPCHPKFVEDTGGMTDAADSVPTALGASNTYYITFATNTANPLSDTAWLEPVLAILQQQPTTKVRIDGYTDDIGTMTYNIQLSQRRAVAVAKAFQAKGISPDRIITHWHGENNPLKPNTSAANRSENRRVEITLITATTK